MLNQGDLINLTIFITSLILQITKKMRLWYRKRSKMKMKRRKKMMRTARVNFMKVNLLNLCQLIYKERQPSIKQHKMLGKANSNTHNNLNYLSQSIWAH